MRISYLLVMLLLLAVPGPGWGAEPAPVPGKDGMVVSAQHLASDIGAQILRDGGNAVDAAVAVGYALAVTYPAAGNLGGGGFMTIRLKDGRTDFLDFREKAPLAATATMFLGPDGIPDRQKSWRSWLAVGVPGTPAGLEAARLRYGRLSRAALLAPAIKLARDGFMITPDDLALFAPMRDLLAANPATAAIFLPGGHLPAAYSRFRQPDLARSLTQISTLGPKRGFYDGPT
ncbi:MAG: gamma-glutamyltransferase, partial [Acidocella sp.]|nr:gamma-glutamyltransferase [Acidocella sp.]